MYILFKKHTDEENLEKVKANCEEKLPAIRPVGQVQYACTYEVSTVALIDDQGNTGWSAFAITGV